jgi:predicted small integral membrane protein
MKFGKQLEEQAIAEWKSKYVDYKQLKKLITNIQRHKERDRTRSDISQVDSKKEYVPRPLVDEEKNFLSTLSSEVKKVEEFYNLQLQDGKDKKKVISLQLIKLDREERLQWSHTNYSNFVDLFSVDVHKLKTTYKDAVNEVTGLLSPRSEGEVSITKPPNRLKAGTQSEKAPERNKPSEQESPFAFHLKSNIVQYVRQNNLQLAHLQLKKALLELYRALELLKSYRELNITAYQKIVKKFEKNAHLQMKDLLLKEFYETRFYQSVETETLMKEVENLFKIYFTHGNRSQAVKTLRTVHTDFVTISAGHIFPIYSTGFFTGVNLLLLIFLFINLTTVIHRPHPHINTMAFIYFGLGFPFLISNLLAVNMYIWDLYKINYRLICGVNPNASTSEYASYVSFLTTVYISLTFLSLTSYFDEFLSPAMQIWFIIFIMIFLLLFPTPTRGGDAYPFSSRTWFFNVVRRIMVTPWHTCVFKDFFLADQFVSIGPFFISLGLLISLSKNGFTDKINSIYSPFGMNGQNLPFSWYIPLLAMIPYYWRCMQSIRRYYDGLAVKAGTTQLWNCSRYFLGMSVVILQTCNVVYGKTHLSVLYLLLSLRILYSLFSLYWDINMDWGLGHCRMTLTKTVGHKNENMTIYPRWVYFYVMLTDGLFRFAWLAFFLVQFYDGQPLSYAGYSLALIEVFRRFQWNFIRVEIEHVHNCEKYRATAEIALPFSSSDLFLNENRRRNDIQQDHIEEGSPEESDLSPRETTEVSEKQKFLGNFAFQPLVNKVVPFSDDSNTQARENNNERSLSKLESKKEEQVESMV